MNAFWPSQRVLVTGGAGFLGSFVVEQLRVKGAMQITIPRSRDCDLREASHVDRLLTETKPTLIIHLAAACGGIGINQAEPGRFFYDNAIMGIQLIEYARRHGVPKFVQVGTVCAYPKFTAVPFLEENLWEGYPEETNAPYGLAKKMLLVQLQAYRQQYGFNGIYLLPANLYGPRDNFNLETSHVVPALIRKFLEAKDRGARSVTLWGTGSASRDFFYVEDAARGILLAAEKYNSGEPINLGTGQDITIAALAEVMPRAHVEDAARGILLAAEKYNSGEPINLGTGQEITIQALAEMIQQATGFTGTIVWDHSKPDGQPRRSVSAEKAHALGFTPQTSITEGLSKTLHWYLAQHVRT
jgi:GDP-L-fucose synthase